MDEYDIRVEGMHCRSCEEVIKEELGEMPGIRGVDADRLTGIVRIRYDGSLDLAKIKTAVAALGHKVKE